MQSESTCFEKIKIVKRKRAVKELTSPWQKERKRCVSPFLVMKSGKGKRAHKDKPVIYFLCFLKRNLSLWGFFYVGVLAGGGAAGEKQLHRQHWLWRSNHRLRHCWWHRHRQCCCKQCHLTWCHGRLCNGGRRHCSWCHQRQHHLRSSARLHHLRVHHF